MEKFIEDQTRPRVIDHNYKGEVRLRYADESPWNYRKEKNLLKDILLQKKAEE